jgi:hypothetical protein
MFSSIWNFVCLWHQPDLPARPLFGRERGESGSDADIVKPSKMTHRVIWQHLILQ